MMDIVLSSVVADTQQKEPEEVLFLGIAQQEEASGPLSARLLLLPFLCFFYPPVFALLL